MTRVPVPVNLLATSHGRENLFRSALNLRHAAGRLCRRWLLRIYYKSRPLHRSFQAGGKFLFAGIRHVGVEIFFWLSKPEWIKTGLSVR